jgi:pterin-4a-carbinolamine dehydratase/ribonuclease HI
MWNETKHGLYKQFNFKDFNEAWYFMTQVAALAEAQQHHPRWENEWSVVQIWLITHDAGSTITDKDRFMAKAIDALVSKGPTLEQPFDIPKVEKVKIFADGGSRGNPGPSASGYVILNQEDKVLVDKGVYIALKLALEECRKMNVQEVQVYMDSMLVVNQMKGIFKIKNRELWPIHDTIKKLADGFKEISFQHVPREFNKLADAAVNRALDDELHSTQSSPEA